MSMFVRPHAAILAQRLREPRRFIQVLAGPRQVGKTTLVQQVIEAVAIPSVYAVGDEPVVKDGAWIEQQWEHARLRTGAGRGGVLVLDEVQKIAGWSEAVKRLWDADTRVGSRLQVVLLGSAPLLMQRGLTESLMGRFEVIRLPHWSFAEMRDAFGVTLDEYAYYGAYPGAAPLIGDPARWRRYVLDSLIETTISRDVLLLTRVDKPALLRRLFELGCVYSGQVLSYQKMVGQLQDAGNTTTLSHYLDLLSGAGMLTGLAKHSTGDVRERASSPKLQVLNTALMSALSSDSLDDLLGQPDRWGRWVESAVGAHLANAAMAGECEVFYWRDRGREVDYVVRSRNRVTAIEVKSGRRPDCLPGMAAFAARFSPDRQLLVGGGGIPVDEFLSRPVGHWAAG